MRSSRGVVMLALPFVLATMGMAYGADLVAGSWKIFPPLAGSKDLPSLAADIEYDPGNDLRGIAFACDRERFYLLVVAPDFKYEPVNPARLTYGDGGPTADLVLRDLYGAPVADSPRLDWDASILYGELATEDFSAMAPLASLTLAIGEKSWRLALKDFEPASAEFLSHCATGAVGDGRYYATPN